MQGDQQTHTVPAGQGGPGAVSRGFCACESAADVLGRAFERCLPARRAPLRACSSRMRRSSATAQRRPRLHRHRRRSQHAAHAWRSSASATPPRWARRPCAPGTPGLRPAVRSPRAREKLTELVPPLLVDVSRAGSDPDAAVAGFDRALERFADRDRAVCDPHRPARALRDAVRRDSRRRPAPRRGGGGATRTFSTSPSTAASEIGVRRRRDGDPHPRPRLARATTTEDVLDARRATTSTRSIF